MNDVDAYDGNIARHPCERQRCSDRDIYEINAIDSTAHVWVMLIFGTVAWHAGNRLVDGRDRDCERAR